MAPDIAILSNGYSAVRLLGVEAGAGPSMLSRVAPWLVSTAILFVGLFVFGFADLARTAWQRIWAIAGICQTEAIRKRILWVTPLGMIGVIVVSQFTQPIDQQDAIRQTVKFCLFTSGLLVTLTAVILACTNLPREIENRVIFTVVTKPTTRLEIVLGKVVGFARVSGLIILIMGLFTFVYLKLRARPMLDELATKIEHLKQADPNSPELATDEYYLGSRLLGTRSLDWSDNMQIYARPPEPGKERWMVGGMAQYFVVPMDLRNPEVRDLIAGATEKKIPVYIKVVLDVHQEAPTQQQQEEADQMGLSAPPKIVSAPIGPMLPSTAPTTAPAQERAYLTPQVKIRFLDKTRSPINTPYEREGGIPVNMLPQKPGEPYATAVQIDPEVVRSLLAAKEIYVQATAATPATEFGVADNAVSLIVPVKGAAPIGIAPDPADHSASPRPAQPIFSAYPARHGLRLGPTPVPGAIGPLAVFSFHDTPVSPDRDGKVGLQISATIEKTGDFVGDSSHSTGTIEVVNRTSGQSSGRVAFVPETSRAQPVGVDVKYFEGGNFDVYLRNETPNQFLGITDGAGPEASLAVIAADRDFLWNLLKSLLSLWMLSILVVIIAVFCSTFVSWPIAVVLTMLILLGHWGVDQLGDALKPGNAGRATTTSFGIRDVATAHALSTGVDNLSAMLRFVSIFLPDVSRFPVTEDIERGVSISPAEIGEAAGVLYCYGLPMLVFSYLILRRKEVAP